MASRVGVGAGGKEASTEAVAAATRVSLVFSGGGTGTGACPRCSSFSLAARAASYALLASSLFSLTARRAAAASAAAVETLRAASTDTPMATAPVNMENVRQAISTYRRTSERPGL